MADKIKFSKGLSSAMGNVAKTAGQFLLQTDTGNLFVDLSSTSRLQIKDSTKLSLSGGNMTGAINMGSKKITSLAAPTDSADAVTKGYVDTLVSGTIDPSAFASKDDLDKKLDKTGGTVSSAFSLTAKGITVSSSNNTISLAAGTSGITATGAYFRLPTARATSTTLTDAVNLQYLKNNFGSVNGIDDGVLA